MTYTVYITAEGEGLFRVSTDAPPGRAEWAYLLRVRGEVPPELPVGAVTLQALLEWAADVAGRNYALGKMEGPYKP